MISLMLFDNFPHKKLQYAARKESVNWVKFSREMNGNFLRSSGGLQPASLGLCGVGPLDCYSTDCKLEILFC